MEKLVPKLRFPEFKSKWVEFKLGNLFEMKSGNFVPANEIENISNSNLYPCYGGNGLRGYTKTFTHKGKYNIIGRQGALCGNVNLVEGSFHATEHAVVVNNNENHNTDFLFYILNNLNLNRLSTGQAQPGLSITILNSVKFFSTLIEEQQKIATFLTSVDERLTLLAQQKEKLELYKKGVMQQIFPSTSSGQAPKLRFKDENGNTYPDWEEKKLGDLVDVVKGKQLNKEELSEVGTYPCQNGGIEPSGYTEEFNTIENTITISEGGNSCGYVNFMTSKFWCGGHCYSLVNIKKSTLNHFLFQYLKFNQNEIMKLRVGSGLPNIQKGSITNFRIEIPCIEEQQKIASFLSAIDVQIEGVIKKIEQTKLFKKGLLQQLFV